MAEERSLFDPRRWCGTDADRRAYLDFMRALGLLAPDPLYEMLWEWRWREAEATEPGVRARIEEDARRGISAFPGLASGLDVGAVAAAHAAFLVGRGADWVYHAACKTVPGLLDEVVTFDGADRLRRAATWGPVIIAAFHFSSSELLVGGLARRFAPVSIVVSDSPRRPEVHEARDAVCSFTEADIRLLRSGSVAVLLDCLRALRAGRLVVIFPELSFREPSEDSDVIMFGGRAICPPPGIAALASKSGAAVLPCHLERPRPGYFRAIIGESFQAGPNLTSDIFGYCEALVRKGLAADWDFWTYAPYLIRMPRSWPRVSAMGAPAWVS